MMISNWFKPFGLHDFYKIITKFNPYSAEIDFSRQNMTSVNVRFWRLISIPALIQRSKGWRKQRTN